MTNEAETAERKEQELRASFVDGLRRRGWARLEAECEAEERIERLRAKWPA